MNIFVGNLSEATKELSENVSQKISDFVRNNAGEPGKIENLARVWRNGLRMYDSIIVVNEEVDIIADGLEDDRLILG